MLKKTSAKGFALPIIIIGVAIVLLLLIGIAKHKKQTADLQNVSSSTSTSVPAEYASLYNQQKQTLDSYSSTLSSQMPSTKYPVIYGTELLVANANRGTDLLKPNAIQGVQIFLDRLKELGIQGVTIAVSYPLLKSDFPNSSQYLAFYKQVAQEVRSRGMKLEVEQGVIFANTGFSKLPVNYNNLRLTQFKSDVHQMSQQIINTMAPDYLNIGAEPDTMASLMRMPELNTPTGFTDFVKTDLAGLNKGTTLVGAGGDSWSSTDFSQSVAQNTSIDFLTLHIYPLSAQIIDNIATIGTIAKKYNKKLIIDETWLYKMGRGDSTSNVAATTTIFQRDAFSFWAPLDQEYIRTMAKLAQVQGVTYFSPFWSNYFFAYLPYDDTTKNLSFQAIQAPLNAAVVKNIQADTFSSTGLDYKQLITGN